MNNKGFSAIELLAVIIILTIIALISIPIVLNIINDQKKSQKWHEIDSYGKNIEIALERYKAKNNKMTVNFEELKPFLTIDKRIECEKVKIDNNGGVHLSECSIDGELVLDINGEAYKYNTQK